MRKPKIPEKDVDELLASGTLSVFGNPEWGFSGGKHWHALKMKVAIATTSMRHPDLRLVLSVSKEDREKISVVLLWNGVRARGLDIKGNHTNSESDGEQWTERTHKHKWTDRWAESHAYTPTDITEDTPRGVFDEFCQECGIQNEIEFPDLPDASPGVMFA